MKLVIVGNGGHTNDIRMILHEAKPYSISKWEKDPLDDKYKTTRRTYSWPTDFDIIDDKYGAIEDQYIQLLSHHGSELHYLIGVNSSKDRRSIAERLNKIHGKVAPPLIHQTAVEGWRCQIFDGVVMGAYSVITTRVNLHSHVHLNTGASVNQKSVIGAFSTLSPGARVCGDVTIGEAVQMGANSTVINLVKVGDNTILGAGAVVTNDLPSDVTAVGVPARVIQKPDDYTMSWVNLTGPYTITTSSGSMSSTIHYQFPQEEDKMTMAIQC